MQDANASFFVNEIDGLTLQKQADRLFLGQNTIRNYHQ